MTTRFQVLAFIVLASSQSWGQAEKNQLVGGYMDTVIVAGAPFSETELTRLSLEIVQDHPAAFRNVWFFASDTDAGNFRGGKFAAELSYALWQSAYQKLRETRMPIGKMVSIGSSAVLLVRDSQRHVTRRILSGTDPLTTDIAGNRVDLLHFTTSAVLAGSEELRIQVFARASVQPTEAIAGALLRALAPKLPYKEIGVSLRQDPWFIDDAMYPLFPPFDPDAPPPSREQFVNSRTVGCSKGHDGRVSCSFSDRHD